MQVEIAEAVHKNTRTPDQRSAYKGIQGMRSQFPNAVAVQVHQEPYYADESQETCLNQYLCVIIMGLINHVIGRKTSISRIDNRKQSQPPAENRTIVCHFYGVFRYS